MFKFNRLSTVAFACALILSGCAASKEAGEGEKTVVVYQPSHQTDTGVEFNEAQVCNGIVEGAIAASTSVVKVFKVWSHDAEGLHHARGGSNTKIEHTAAIDSLGRLSGYAFELREAAKLNPHVFISVHNNGATNKHACWGFVHEVDQFEKENRELAKELVDEICRSTGLVNAGVFGDSWPNRNDYRCAVTGKLSFYSLDENINRAPYRVLLEIGDNKVSYDFLRNLQNQEKIGEVVQRVIERRFGSTIQ